MIIQGGSPGVVVMEDDSKSRGRGSNPGAVYWIELTFFTLICSKNCINVCFKRPKINKKEVGVGPFKKIKLSSENNI